jgi:hypothetical protein
MMTITELREALTVLEGEGLGKAPVLMASDAEGNSYQKLDEMSRGVTVARTAYGVEFRPLNEHGQVNCVCLFPEG